LPDKELIQQLRLGDEQAFRTLVTQYQDKVYHTALNFLQHTTDAEDIAQEVFIQVYHSIGQFKEQSKLSTWIYRITVSKCLDLQRSKKRKKRFSFITSLFSDKQELLHDPADFNHPGILYDQKQDAALLYQAIQQLSEKQQSAFLLYKTGQMSYLEIAGILGTTEPAVDSLLQRAKQNLRKFLEKNSPDSG
jgi:RNA polymerase sigma-70 factor (ECF subfamily)